MNEINGLQNSNVQPQTTDVSLDGGRRLSLTCRPESYYPPSYGWPGNNYGEGFFGRILDQFMGVIENLVGVIERAISAIPSAEVQDPQTVNDVPAETPAASAPEQAAPAAGDAPKNDTKKLGKTGEFLWKPESDKNGKLAILLPGNLTGKVKSVKVLSPDGSKVLEKGKFSGTGNPKSGNDREHYRFEKAGGKFPDNSIVEVTLNSGKKIQVKIRETSSRFER